MRTKEVIIIAKKRIPRKKNDYGFNNKRQFAIRSIALMVIFFLVFLVLIVRIGYIQFVKGPEYKESAYKQQTKSHVIASKRGTIYDSTNHILAISSPVDTISISKGEVLYKDSSVVPNEVLAQGFSEIFDLKYEEIYETITTSKSSNITIAKRVEQEKVDKLNAWMEENDISSGINIDEDSKRTYPYNNLASNIIGFYGTDTGIDGIENSWNDELSGTPGRIVTSTNVNKQAISDENEQYVPAQNGMDLYLTVDAEVQSIAEKYLEQAIVENKAKGGCIIIMRPSTGDILAEASYPTYNLNDPYTPNTDELKKKWDKMSSAEKNTALFQMWRNKPISNGYEPGSTFKIITSSIALEENLVETDTKGDFHCNHTYVVNGIPISCWYRGSHGSLSLRGALENSCNPSFIQLGQRIGKKRFYKYLEGFGLLGKTNIRLPGEASGYFYDYDKCNALELATMSFGQRFTITPLQLITSVSACVNGGDLMQPRIVSKMVNPDTGVVTEIEPVKVRQVISKNTSDKIKDLMHSVVTEGTGKSATVAGYTVGGKSGTSEPPVGHPEEGYSSSFVAISPAENPEVAVLIVINKPAGSYHGGTVCAPVASKILSEVLPHLGITSTKTTKTKEKLTSIPSVTSKTLSEAKKTLENAGFEVVMKSSDSSDGTVVSQTPVAGTSLKTGSIICLYTKGAEKKKVKVPDLKGKTAAQAKNSLNALNLNISVEGSGKIVSQSVNAGTSVAEGSVITVTLKKK